MKRPTPLLIGFEGTTLNKTLERRLKGVNPAGVVLFKRNFVSFEQGKKLIADLRGLLGDIIVAVDHEGGTVNRFPSDFPAPPSPRSLKEAGRPDLIRKACVLQAEALEYLGVNLNFAPVLDISGYPGNQVIGTRAFSSDPLEVADYGIVCLEEHKRLKIGIAAKHFPGHGRTSVDSHLSLGSVKASFDSLWKEDLSPFDRIIKMGVPAIMTAHLIYPALDAVFPATFSKKIITDLLRKKMNFSGLAITDCVEMKAVSKDFFPEDIIRLGLQAGADLWISSFSLKQNYEWQLALKQAFDKISREADDTGSEYIANSQRRLDDFLQKHPSNINSEVLKSQSIENDFPRSQFIPALELHRGTLLKSRQSPIPDGYDKFCLLELSNREYSGINEGVFRNAAIDELAENCPLIVDKKIIFQNDIAKLPDYIKLCDDNKHTLLLLTSNGFRQKRYFEFVSLLKKAASVVHIALLDKKDLLGVFSNEWATWGYNCFTGKMLAEELMKLTPKS